MSRGPLPHRAIAMAMSIASLRGIIQENKTCRERLYDFTIASSVPVAFVRIKYAVRILATLQEIEEDFREEIHRFRSMIRDQGISCELWLQSRHGTWRFFRIAAGTLIELNRDGQPLDVRDVPRTGNAAV